MRTAIILVATTMFFTACLGEHDPGITASDGSQIVTGFVDSNGTRLRPANGWKCEDGAQGTNGAFFDTRTNQRCQMSVSAGGDPLRGPYYCAPLGSSADSSRDVRCSFSIMP